AEAEQTSAGLPKLRLAPKAVAPPAWSELEPVEEAPADEHTNLEAVEEPVPTPEVAPTIEEVEETEAVEEVQEIEDTDTSSAEPLEVAPDADASPEMEPEHVVDEQATSADAPHVVEADPAELESLRAEVERLEGALIEAQASAGEQERLLAEVEK